MVFDIGPVSTGASRTLAVLIGLYALGTMRFALKGLRRELADRWSAVVATFVMVALAVLLWVEGPRLVPAPFAIWLLIIAAAGIVVTLTWTLARYQERVDAFKEDFGKRMQTLLDDLLPEERQAELRRLRERFRMSHEERRKMPHLLMGMVVVSQLGLGYVVLHALYSAAYGGVPGPDAGEGVHNLYEATHSGVLVSSHFLSVFVLLALLLLIVPNELLRLRYPELSYPFKTTILNALRAKEKGLFGAHYYIVAATPLAVLWMARHESAWATHLPAAISIVAVAVFADAASALIGVNLGKTKWFHNPDKSYAGTIGGAVVAFGVAVPLVGVPVAVATAVTFTVVDILAPVPFPASDNLLNPVALAITYTLMADQIQPLVPFY